MRATATSCTHTLLLYDDEDDDDDDDDDDDNDSNIFKYAPSFSLWE